MLAQQALRAGVSDPLTVLRPGDPFEKQVLRSLVEVESRRRDTERMVMARSQAILTGQVMALCLDVPGERVASVGAAIEEMLGGEADVR